MWPPQNTVCSLAYAVKKHFKSFECHRQPKKKSTKYIDGATITERKQTNNAYRANIHYRKNRKMGWHMKKACKQQAHWQTDCQSVRDTWRARQNESNEPKSMRIEIASKTTQ